MSCCFVATRRQTSLVSAAVVIVVSYCLTGLAGAYTLQSPVIDAGGDVGLRGGSYRVGLSLGQQTASGVLGAGLYRATLGFWHSHKDSVGVVEEVGQTVHPLAFRLGQNVPNPFCRRMVIEYALPHASDVALRIYNSAGRIVTTLVNGRQRPGRYTVSWDVSGVPATRLPCGTYFCRLEAGEFTATRKMVKTE